MAFTGLATYDNLDAIKDSISDMVSMISPFETPLLDYIGDADQPAVSVLHEWIEDALNPSTIIASSAVASATADTAFRVNGIGNQLQVGDILQANASDLANEELLRVTVITGANSITVARAIGGVGSTAITAGSELNLIASAALEGADIAGDLSRARTRKNNVVQLFQKPINVSDTQQAVSKIGVSSEIALQTENRTKEILRELERAVIVGAKATSGNTLGSDSDYRTMQGIWRSLTTNNHSASTFSESFLGNVVAKSVWDQGANDADVIVSDGLTKRAIDNLAESRIRTTQDEATFKNEITRYESSYGGMDVIVSRWMNPNTFMILAKDRVKIVPLTGRSFQTIPLSRTGHSEKSAIVGEYTVEVRNEEGMAKAKS